MIVTIIRCDGCHDTGIYSPTAGSNEKRQHAHVLRRKLAAKRRVSDYAHRPWHNVGPRDYCGTCWAEMKARRGK